MEGFIKETPMEWKVCDLISPELPFIAVIFALFSFLFTLFLAVFFSPSRVIHQLSKSCLICGVWPSEEAFLHKLYIINASLFNCLFYKFCSCLLVLGFKEFCLDQICINYCLGVTWPFLLCCPQNCYWWERSGRVWKCFLRPMFNEYWLLIPLKPLIPVYKVRGALIQQFCERIFQQLPSEGSINCM